MDSIGDVVQSITLEDLDALSLGLGNAPPFQYRFESIGDVIQSTALVDLDGSFFGPENAPPFQYRFIDCKALLECNRLELHAFRELPVGQYSTISYVWDGLPAFKKQYHSFRAQGAEEIGNISVEVISSACRLSMLYETRFMWLDCVCILQGHDSDKAWHIVNMATIYKHCNLGIILPGGLLRLTRLAWKEPSRWALRRWTLQEAALPKRSFCLFQTKLGSGTVNGAIEILQLDSMYEFVGVVKPC